MINDNVLTPWNIIEKYTRVEESDDEIEDDAGGDEVSVSFF